MAIRLIYLRGNEKAALKFHEQIKRVHIYSQHDSSWIQQAMEECFSLDNFASTFKFVQGWIDLERSSAAVQKWCKGMSIVTSVN